MVDGGSEGFRLHRRGRIVPILIVVIGSVIQIGVIVRIVGIPINRPAKLLKKATMVAMKETAGFMKSGGRTKSEIPPKSKAHPQCPARPVSTEPHTTTRPRATTTPRVPVQPS